MHNNLHAGIGEILLQMIRQIKAFRSNRMQTDVIVLCQRISKGVNRSAVTKITLKPDVNIFEPHRLANRKQIQKRL